ncbi:MAG TPA: DUF488 family protein, partial [Elusimicrobiota bacterium]|nr:DUF488 family protein [Elusimicrobiota bacterium]
MKRAGGRHGGYRVLASRKRGSQAADAWAPQLAPSLGLLRSLRSGAALWEALLAAYEEELRGAAAQDVLKPLALLSRRKALTLLCDCPEDARCLHLVLARALEECRR